MKQVIYETTGRAREFNELAINLFSGCGHGCIYCYGADVLHQKRTDFVDNPKPRVTLDDIDRSARLWQKMYNGRRILLCFITDPYQPIEADTKLTRSAIEILHKYGMNVIILTKGGLRSMRDFDLLTSKDAYATTLTCLHQPDSLYWEPKAALPHERIRALMEAYERGIETWVSFEPVIYPQDTMYIVEAAKDYVGHFKIGKLNYVSQLPPEYQQVVLDIDWNKFGWDMKALMDRVGANYYFKKDLLKEMGITPENFKQTWECK